MRDAVAELTISRDQLAHGLANLGLRVLSAPTNFVLAEIGNHAGELHAALLAEGMVVRDYPESSPLGAYLRFTARSREANRRLLTRIAHHMS